MPSPFALLPNVTSQAAPQIITGQVSTAQPSPSTFTDPLYVIRPGIGTTNFWVVTDWPACHGTTLPAPGAACLLVIDATNIMRCVWWDADGATFPVAETPPAAAITGTGAPAATVGVDGQLYIDTSTLNVWGPMVDGAWPASPLGKLTAA